MDKIYIKNLEVFARHGVFPEENALGQKFLISAVLYTDTRKAGMTDDLTASIHYGEVSQMMKAFIEENTSSCWRPQRKGWLLKCCWRSPIWSRSNWKSEKPSA